MRLVAVVGGLIGGAGVLAKEIGKGGGGSTEEPTVCMTLLPVAVGVAVVAAQSLRRLGRQQSLAPGH